MLAFAMVVTTFVGIIPPLEVSAATTGASFTSLKASSTKVYEGDSVQISGTAKRSGSYYLRAIQINVRNEGDDDHGFRVDRVDFEASEKKTSYSLSKLDSLEIGSYTCSGCGEKETLGVGKHRIDVSIGVYDSNGNKADTAGITQSIWIEVLEEEAPYVKSIAADVDGTEVEFTVKTNLTAKHGIVLYADGYELDMIDWDKDTYSSYIKYTGSHVFNQVGTVGRLMLENNPILTITNDKGEKVLSIPLIDYALLVKGHYNRQMDNQEYLDRQDEYNMTFFLDEDDHWVSSYIIINSWKVVLNNEELS